MAGIKEFFTRFNIGAVFTGQKAFNQANAAVKHTEKQATLANVSLRKLIGSTAALLLGYRGIASAGDFLKSSIDAARESKDAHDKLYLTLFRNTKLQAEIAKTHKGSIKGQADALGELAERMEKTGFDAETLMAGFTGLSKSFSPKQIEAMSSGFSDLIARTQGTSASAESVVEITDKINKAIKYGSPLALKALKLSQDQIKAFKGMKEGERVAFMYKFLNKQTGDTARLMETSKGAVYRNRVALDNLRKAIGGPMIESQDAFTRSMTDLYVALLPAAEALGRKLGPAVHKLADTIRSNMPQIVVQIGRLVDAFQYIIDHADDIVNALKWIVGGFLAFKAVQGVVNTINAITSAFQGLQLVLTAGPGLWAALTNPVGLVVLALVAVALAAYFVWKNWDKIGPKAKQAWNQIVQVWGQAAAWLKAKVVEPIKRALEPIWKPLVAPLKRLWGEISPLLDQLVGYIIGSFKTLPGSLKWIWDNVIVGAANRLKDLITVVGPIAMQAFQNWASVVGWIASYVIAPIINGFADIVGKLKAGDLWGAFQSWVDTVNTVRQNVIDKIVALFQDMAPAITAALAGVGSAITAAFEGPLAAVKGWIDGIGAAWNALVGNLNATKLPSPTGAFQSGGAAAESKGATGGYQLGGLVAHPSIAKLAERGIPEMVIPLQGTQRSRGLLSHTATAIGAGGPRGGLGGAAPVSLTMNAPITINGVPGGQEGAIGREVQRALEDPIRNLLEQLRVARNYESRLSYV